jgi:hypothetical protein
MKLITLELWVVPDLILWLLFKICLIMGSTQVMPKLFGWVAFNLFLVSHSISYVLLDLSKPKTISSFPSASG